jgi:hypothetical protein
MDAPHPPSQANQRTDEVAPPEFVYAALAPALDAEFAVAAAVFSAEMPTVGFTVGDGQLSSASKSDPAMLRDCLQTAQSGAKMQARTRAKTKPKTGKRLKWSNAMVEELLRLRFKDDEVRNRIDSADTKIKTALAWQFFASKLSQALALVITRDQVYTLSNC